MTHETMQRMETLDMAVAELADGAYIQPAGDEPDYDLRKILNYCAERGMSPSALSDAELARFVRRSA